MIEKVEAARKQSKNKAPGFRRCDTCGSLYGNRQDGVRAVHHLCQLVWTTTEWPKDWITSVIVHLHKKGSTTQYNNYRLIALISHASKILLQGIRSRLDRFISWQIASEQAGFVRERGTREQILNIHQLIEKAREFNTSMYLRFVDYEKAFDNVQWHRL